MRRLIATAAVAIIMAVGTTGTAWANPPNPACHAMDRAHAQIYGTGTPAELALRDLRLANHCGH